MLNRIVLAASSDRHFETARAAAAHIAHPPKDVDHRRTYWANDPEGHPWFLTSPPKTL